MRRYALAFLALGRFAYAGSDGGTAPSPSPEPRTFRLEGKPAIEDVFGDASDYRRTIDRFAELVRSMQSTRDEFARAVQGVLAELKKSAKLPKRGCPVDAVSGPYGRSHTLGIDYLRLGRELTRHHEQIKEYDRLGETLALTPDYRWRVKNVLQQYQLLLTDYREMKIAFHDQLLDELKYAGCDADKLQANFDSRISATDDGGPTASSTKNDAWPVPGAPGAPGVATKEAPLPPAETPPPTVPSDVAKDPIAIKKPMPADPSAAGRSGIYFYVDNTKCQKGTTVFLDGKKLGEVASGVRSGFQTLPGPHDLCLIDDPKKECGAPGTIRRNYLSEGWTISLRCE